MTLPAFEVASAPAGVAETVRDAFSRRLPARYATDIWDRPFRARLSAALRPGLVVLDLGAGATPTLAPAERPEGTRYVGLDIDPEELRKAPPGSYDEAVVGSAEHRVPGMEGRFDLVLSFLALEHVRSTYAALDNARAYLRPGGRLLAQLAGAFTPSALANRLLPAGAARRLLRRTQGRDPQTVFAARYDRCWYTALDRALAEGWADREVVPLFTGAGYVLFSRPLTAAYIAYEEWAYRGRHRNLATFYLLSARRPAGAVNGTGPSR